MNQSTNSDIVWNKVVEDPSFAKMSDKTKTAIRPYIDQMPQVVQDLASIKVSYKSLLQAKALYLRFVLTKGLFEAHINSLTKRELGLFTKKQLIGQTKAMTKQLLESFESIANDAEQILSDMGITDQEAMLSENMGLTPEARELYVQGNLTIGKLIEIQPILIVKNTN